MIINKGSIGKSEKRKRLSDSKAMNGDYYKISLQKKTHNRSSSTTKNRKTRLMTDYQEYETNYPVFQPTRIKKSYQDQKYQTKKALVMIDGSLGQQPLIHSTKNNPHKNMQLKNLFKNYQKNTQIKFTGLHPIVKYISNKNKTTGININQQHQSSHTQKQSPYAKQISRFQQIYLKNQFQANKKKSTHKRQGSFSLNKNQIKLSQNQININLDKKKPNKFINQTNVSKSLKRQEEQQSTVKTIKKKQNQKQDIPKDITNSEDGDDQDQGYGLTDQQTDVFGDRFPYGFQKVKLLGRGGFSLVWLGKHIKSGKLFAIKQIITQNTHQTHIKQIWFGTMFFTLGGVPKPQYSAFPGIKNLVRMYSYQINQTDTWIFYERCGQSLGSTLYDIRSEKLYGQQRLYKIFYKPIYQAMEKDPKILIKIIAQICKTLALLSETQIVHSDLKTENILIRYDQNPLKITQVKLIDYGSSFEFKNISQFSMATPEYMPPQILNYIIHQNEGQYEEQLYQKVMTQYKNPWVVDMWSLGCVMLEIVIGVPLWMSLPLLVPTNRNSGSFLQKEGLFAVKGRLFPQIIQKQRKVVKKLDEIVAKQNHSKIILSPNLQLVLKGMLEIDFSKRISPMQVLTIISSQL